MSHLLFGQELINKFLSRNEKLRAWDSYKEYDHQSTLKKVSPAFPGANFGPTHSQEFKILKSEISRGLFFFTDNRIVFAENSTLNEGIEKDGVISIFHSNEKPNQIVLQSVMYKGPGLLGGGHRFLIRLSKSLPGRTTRYFAFGLSEEYAIASMKNVPGFE